MVIKKIVGLGLSMALPVCGINFSFAGEDAQAYESMETGEASLMEDSEAYTDANIIGGNIYYNPDTGEITSCDKDVISAVIPSSINGVRITSIGGRAFYKCENLIKAEIPDSVTNISDGAFCVSAGLKSISVSEKNTAYTSDGGVLFNKNKTEILAYPKGLESTSYTIPDSVKSVGFGAFYGCAGLKEIKIPDGAVIIDKCAFYGSGLTMAEIPEGVTRIEEWAFSECADLKEIKIPNGVTGLGNYAFYGCSDLAEIEIPNSVESIGDFAFMNCAGLKEIEISSGVARIGDFVFFGCENLKSINVAENNLAYSSVDGVLYNKSKTEILFCPESLESTKYVIPEGVTKIGEFVFSGRGGIRAIEIPDSVTRIEDGAFRDCTGLTEIKIPDGVTSVGNVAFTCCENLTGIEIPDSVISIGYSAFESCGKLTEIKLPHGIKSIGESAFLNCGELKRAEIPNGVASIGNGAFMHCGSLTGIEIPESVTSIGEYAFADCPSLEYINAAPGNPSYTSIDGVLFNKNKTKILSYPLGSKNESYEIPKGVISIGSQFVFECDSQIALKRVKISDGVTSIGKEAFYGGNFMEIEIPDSVKSIDISSLRSCSNLTVFCHENSYAKTFAVENNINYKII